MHRPMVAVFFSRYYCAAVEYLTAYIKLVKTSKNSTSGLKLICLNVDVTVHVF